MALVFCVPWKSGKGAGVSTFALSSGTLTRCRAADPFRSTPQLHNHGNHYVNRSLVGQSCHSCGKNVASAVVKNRHGSSSSNPHISFSMHSIVAFFSRSFSWSPLVVRAAQKADRLHNKSIKIMGYCAKPQGGVD